MVANKRLKTLSLKRGKYLKCIRYKATLDKWCNKVKKRQLNLISSVSGNYRAPGTPRHIFPMATMSANLALISYKFTRSCLTSSCSHMECRENNFLPIPRPFSASLGYFWQIFGHRLGLWRNFSQEKAPIELLWASFVPNLGPKLLLSYFKKKKILFFGLFWPSLSNFMADSWPQTGPMEEFQPREGPYRPSLGFLRPESWPENGCF